MTRWVLLGVVLGLYLTHTTLNGRYTLRLCVGQTRTEERHVERAWQLIRGTAEQLEGEPAASAAG